MPSTAARWSADCQRAARRGEIQLFYSRRNAREMPCGQRTAHLGNGSIRGCNPSLGLHPTNSVLQPRGLLPSCGAPRHTYSVDCGPSCFSHRVQENFAGSAVPVSGGEYSQCLTAPTRPLTIAEDPRYLHSIQTSAPLKSHFIPLRPTLSPTKDCRFFGFPLKTTTISSGLG